MHGGTHDPQGQHSCPAQTAPSTRALALVPASSLYEFPTQEAISLSARQLLTMFYK